MYKPNKCSKFNLGLNLKANNREDSTDILQSFHYPKEENTIPSARVEKKTKSFNIPLIHKNNHSFNVNPGQDKMYENIQFLNSIEKKKQEGVKEKQKKFRTLQNSPRKLPSIHENNIEHLKDQITHAVSILDENLGVTLSEKPTITPMDLVESLRANLLLRKNEAMQFTKYLLNLDNISTNDIVSKINHFVGNFPKITVNFSEYLNQIVSNSAMKGKIIRGLKQLCSKSYISPIEIIDILQNNNFTTNYKVFTSILLRKS